MVEEGFEEDAFGRQRHDRRMVVLARIEHIMNAVR
jgi:hypothetical protein